MPGGSAVNQWNAGISVTFAQGAGAIPPLPALSVLSVPLTPAAAVSGTGNPTAGNWLFAVASWRQDSGTAGVLQYPSTVTITDDAHNFWVPLCVTPPGTGILRTAVWMAPAARVPQNVFASPTAFQQAVTLIVWEYQADCPWYSVTAVASNFTNQGTSVTQSFTPPSGVLALGAIAYDNNSTTVTFTSTGWLAGTAVSTTDGLDHLADITLTPFVATAPGTALTLAASNTGGNQDYSVTMISVHGVADTIAFPYQSLVQAENWPALVTEMACGQTLNANWTFTTGISPWTGNNGATVAASTLYPSAPGGSSMVITPNGSSSSQAAISEEVAGIVPFSTYIVTAEITVPAGYAAGALLAINWLTAGGGAISTSSSGVLTVTGSTQQVTFSAAAPLTAAKAQAFVGYQGTPAATALMYVGYASLGIPGVLGNTPLDQIEWIDLSGRQITQEDIKIGRGIQYENQSLEAGTMELALANNDGAFTAGNQASAFFPFAGQTDVPVRLRAIWPASITPYVVLHSGFTDDIKIQVDEATLYGIALVTSSDVWSRLTAQMLTAGQMEFLSDITAGTAGGFWPCNDLAGSATAHNIAPTSLPALTAQISKYGIGSGVTQAFGATTISNLGDPGGTGWQVSGITGTIAQGQGASLTLLPPNPSTQLPPIASGVTVEFWANVAAKVGSITWESVLAACVNARGLVWILGIGTPGGTTDGQLIFTRYDKTTGAATASVVDTNSYWGTTSLFTVRFTATTWSVYVDGVSPGGTSSGSANFAATYAGFSFNGYCVPFGVSGNCGNFTIQDVFLGAGTLPQNRAISHWEISSKAALNEYDQRRIARVAGYGGFVPPMACEVLGIGPIIVSSSGTALQEDVDPVTQVTDTLGQTVSAYCTNVASSTDAAMFVDGPGTLVYRRRLEWYNRPSPSWVLGENAPLELNADPHFTTLASWQPQNGASVSLAIDTADTLPPQFAFAALWNGNGSTATPQLEYIPAGTIPVTAGRSYQLATWWLSPQGYSTGVTCSIQWKTAGGSTISSSTSTTTPLAANGAAFVTVTAQAPNTAALANIFLTATGTPASSVQFYTGYAGIFISPGEAPYLRDVRLSDDRANMYNYATLNQSGTGDRATNTGTSFTFIATSGVVATVSNQQSVTTRGQVPYTATLYLQNTQQSSLFAPAEGCIEDYGSWVTQTLGNPSLRAEHAHLTPAATWQAMITALQAEIGDTVTVNRRPMGAPAVSLLVYLSHLEHTINIATEGWHTEYEISPAPMLTVLQCDSVTNGVLDSSSLLGW